MSRSTSLAIPNADALYERALSCLPGGNSRSTLFVPPHPPYAARGEGAVLTDVDGHELIDLQNNYTSLVHGHAFGPAIEAAGLAMQAGPSVGLPTQSEVELAELLAQRMPWAPSWRFANSGTEAVMIALRGARAATGRDGFLRFAGCYHGTYDAVVQEGARGVPPAAHKDVLSVPVGDTEAFTSALEKHGESLAAVLLDILPNRAGMRPPDPDFILTVREQTQRRGILLIVDEVITFRLATGGLQQEYGIEADLVTLGKLIGGGFPVGALGGSAEVMAVFDPHLDDAVGHGGTFSANPVTMSAGLASLRALDGGAIERINRLGDRLREKLASQGHTVTGRGSLLRLHPADPTRLWWELYERGVLISANGLACMSTPMDDATVETAVAAFAGVARDASPAPEPKEEDAHV